MRLEGKNTLVISKRNALALAAKADDPDSARTLVGGSEAHGFVLKVEPDDVHYAHRRPGEVHPDHEPGTGFYAVPD